MQKTKTPDSAVSGGLLCAGCRFCAEKNLLLMRLLPVLGETRCIIHKNLKKYCNSVH
jgi:hypothetical protein